MPLLVHAVGWWIAGLLAPWTMSLVAMLVGIAVAWYRAAPRVIAAAALLAPLGSIAATVAQHDLERCTALAERRVLSSSGAWGVVEAAEQRGRQPMTLRLTRYGPCRVSAWVRVVGNPLPPGAIVAVSGRVRRLERGLRIDSATVVARNGKAPRVAWRGRIGASIDRRFGTRAPLVRALLIADQRALDTDLRDQYADAGLVHLLSVSGLHVAIIATALLTLGGLLRIRTAWTETIALQLVLLYVALLGFPAPAVRSAVMLVVTALAKRWQRPVHAWTALALGAVLPTAGDVLVVQDLGWQLSVAGMAALVGAGALQRRWRRWARGDARDERRWLRAWRGLWRLRGWRGHLIGEVTTGTIAVVATAPIIAWHFGRLSVVSPLSNLLAAPLIAVLQPALFLAMLLEPVPLAAQFVADAAQPMMALLDRLATVCGQLPFAVVGVAPERTVVVLIGGAALLVLRSTRAWRMTPWLLAAGLLGIAALWWPVLGSRPHPFELHVLDVGQGDALALRTPKGRWILVDAGPRWEGSDAARRRVIPWIRRRGGEVALFVLTHPHEDHAGGAPTLIEALSPRGWWEAAFVGTSPSYRRALDRLAAQRIPWRRVMPGDRYQLDGVDIEVLAPAPAWVAQQKNANETSVILMVAFGSHRFLLTGDAEGGEEDWLLAQSSRLRADVLKLGHHGSRTSTSRAFLDAVRPRVAIASVGAGNRYGHPAPAVKSLLLRHQIPLLRTDLDGSIIVRSDGSSLTVENDHEQWKVPDDGSSDPRQGRTPPF